MREWLGRGEGRDGGQRGLTGQGISISEQDGRRAGLEGLARPWTYVESDKTSPMTRTDPSSRSPLSSLMSSNVELARIEVRR